MTPDAKRPAKSVQGRGLNILAIDDSVVVRSILKQVLSAQACVAEVSVAASGQIGLKRVSQARPDVILLDLEMGEMSGLETLAKLLEYDPELAVVLFASEGDGGADTALAGLQAGAIDFVAKPRGMNDLEESSAYILSTLLPRLLQIAGGARPPAPIRVSRPKERPAEAAAFVRERHDTGLDFTQLEGIPLDFRRRLDVLAIGVSTGGPNALAKLLETLPGDLPVPVLIVQHMPVGFTKQLAMRLDRLTNLSVCEAAGGELLEAGHVYVAPGDFHMLVEASGHGPRIVLSRSPAEHGCRPAVDPMLRSVARVYGASTLALILTGMGIDGSSGCFEVRKAGGVVMAQDEATSVVWGMPGFAVGAGYCARVLPMDEIGTALGLRLAKGR